MLAEADWTNVASAIAAAIAAVIAAAAAVVAWITYRSQTDPAVIVYATLDPNRGGCMLINVENIGKGVARGVKFRLAEELPALNYIGTEARAKPKMTTGPLITGIPFLEPGGKRTCFWGHYPDLFPDFGLKCVVITATYGSDGVDPQFGREFSSESMLEIGSFQFTDGILFNHLMRIADAAEKIVAAVQRR